MFRLGRVWRKKYEGRVKKRCGTERTVETRKWDRKDREESRWSRETSTKNKFLEKNKPLEINLFRETSDRVEEPLNPLPMRHDDVQLYRSLVR